MIKLRGIFFIGGTIIIAALFAWLASKYLNKPVKHSINIAIAAQDIAPGEILGRKNITIKSWPGNNMPAGSFPGTASLTGRIVARPILKGEPIREIKLVVRGQAAGSLLSKQVPPGMRAVSIKVDNVSSISGMLKKGDLVDVISTSSMGGGKESMISRLILRKIKILAVTTDEVATIKIGKGTVVLLLTLAQAKIIASAENTKIRLIARNPLDEDEPGFDATTFSGFVGARTNLMLKKMIDKKNERLNQSITQGKRAVTIRVNNEDGICGLLRPGNRVDILAAHKFIKTANKRRVGQETTVVDSQVYAKIVMQDIEIMAIEDDVETPEDISGTEPGKKSASFVEGAETSMDKKVPGSKSPSSKSPGSKSPDSKSNDGKKEKDDNGDDKKGTQGRLKTKLTKRVTFLVTPEDAEKLTVISVNSEIKLIVRNYDDREEVETFGEGSNDIFYKSEARRYYQVNVFKGLRRGRKLFDKQDLEAINVFPRRGPRIPDSNNSRDYPKEDNEI